MHRPVDHCRPAQNLILPHIRIRPVSCVPRIIPIIPQHQIRVFRHLKMIIPRRHRPVLFEIILVQRRIRSVNINVSVPDIHGLARKPDHTLHIQFFLVVRITENDNITALRRLAPVCQTVSDQTIPRHDGVLHRPGRHIGIDDNIIFQKHRNGKRDYKRYHPA